MTDPLNERRRRIATAAIVLGMFAAAIEMTIVSTAMPRAAGDLGGSDRYAWVLSIYLLTSSVSAPLFGKLADLFGRRPAYIVGMSLFLLGSWASGVVMTAVTNYVPMLLQRGQGASTRESGLAMTAFAIGWPLAAFSTGMVLARIGVRRAAIGGFALVAAGAGWLALLGLHSPRASFVLGTALIRLGMGMQSTPLLIAVQSAVDYNLRGAATAAFSFARTMGGTIGAILAGALAEQRLHARAIDSATIDHALRPNAPLAALAVREAIADVVHTVLVANAVVAIVALLLSRATPSVAMRARPTASAAHLRGPVLTDRPNSRQR
jgi:MFS family permease